MTRGQFLKGHIGNTKYKRIRTYSTKAGFQGNQHVYKTGYTKDKVKRLKEKQAFPVQNILRLSRHDFRRITTTVITTGSHSYHISTASGNCCPDEHVNVMLLRPQPDPPSLSELYLQKESENIEEMRLLGKNSVTNMYNKCLAEHSSKGYKCENTQLEMIKEIKIGICWQQQLRCKNCRYISRFYKLYQEINDKDRYVVYLYNVS